MKRWLAVFKNAFSDFGADRCSDLAASLSYYTIFAIPPLIILVLMVVGAFVDPASVQAALQGQFAGIMGAQGASAIVTIMRSAQRPDLHSPFAAAVGIVTLLLGAVGFFLALQGALNRSWDVAPDPKRGGVKNFISKRVVSFGMMLVVAFLLLVSLVLSAAITAFSNFLAGYLPGGLSGLFLQAVNFAVSLLVISALFTLLFKVLPDAYVHWRDLIVGGFFTALLFVVGKSLIGLYLGHSHPGNAFGAAGSTILVLVWIYYSSMILLFGAEFTQAYAVVMGHSVRPKAGAVRVIETRASNELANQPDGAGAQAHAVQEKGSGRRAGDAEGAGGEDSRPGRTEDRGGDGQSPEIPVERKEGGSEGRAAD